MRKKIFGLILNIALVFSCIFPLTACGREISTSERQLYLTACKAVNEYAASGTNNISTAFNSSSPLSCNMSDIEESSAIANSLVVTNIRSLSQTGPFTVTVTFKAPIRGKTNTNALLSVLLAFKIKDSAVNASLSEYIFCTTKFKGGDSKHPCNDYTLSDKGAYTPSKVSEIIKKGSYIKAENGTHGSVALASPNTDFNFLTGIELIHGNINVNGVDTLVTKGVLNVAVEVSVDDVYVGNSSNLTDFCMTGLNQLYSSKSDGSSAYTYLEDALEILVGTETSGLGFTDLNDPKILPKTKINFVLNEDWISENAESAGVYNTTSAVGPENSTILYYKGSCNYTIKVFNTSGAFATPADHYITFGKIENTSTGSVQWYILSSDTTWVDGEGFNTAEADLIETTDDYRCPIMTSLEDGTTSKCTFAKSSE